MKKVIGIALAIALIGGGAFFFLQSSGRFGPPQSVAEAAEAEAVTEYTPDGIVVDAHVVPARRADLSLAASGIVSEILVNEGDVVEAQQALLQLDSARQQAALDQAKAQLMREQAQLSEQEAGVREQEISQADASLAAAQARLDRIINGPIQEDIDASKAALSEAKASLRKVQEGATEQELIAARSELGNAQARLRQAQAAYDKHATDPQIGLRPESLELEQATNETTAAQARLDDLKSGSSAADIAAARARVRQSQAQLDALTAQNPADVAAAEAEVRQAQAQLDLLKAGTRSEILAATAAEVAAAEAAVEDAEAALAERVLLAPFAGTIASLDTNLGEQVSAGNAVVRLADFSAWEVETEDLTEFDAVALEPGMSVTINYDAIPDLEQEGTINLIRPIGEDLRGDIVYTVVVEPNETDERLLWNLTAVVTIDQS